MRFSQSTASMGIDTDELSSRRNQLPALSAISRFYASKCMTSN
jgi:hypothetical protein